MCDPQFPLLKVFSYFAWVSRDEQTEEGCAQEPEREAHHLVSVRYIALNVHNARLRRRLLKCVTGDCLM